MIVDSSAIVCILNSEPGHDRVLGALFSSNPLSMSASNYLECCQVIDSKRDPILSRELNELLVRLNVAMVPVTESTANIARGAFRLYGKGMNSKAKLNHCDCIAYALAKETGKPLLFVGNDFVHTDVIPALDPPVLAPE